MAIVGCIALKLSLSGENFVESSSLLSSFMSKLNLGYLYILRQGKIILLPAD